jgi:hypothetical protein
VSPILGIWASQNYSRVAPNSYESIATVNVASTSSSITFSSIPSTYKHLQVRVLGRVPSFTIVTFQVNGDTGNNYSIHNVGGDGSSTYVGATSSYNFGGAGVLSPATSTFSANIIDILDYTNTNKFKNFRTLSGYDANGSGRVELRSSLWQSTSAITSLVFTTDSLGAYQQYTQFALYGIKG